MGIELRRAGQTDAQAVCGLLRRAIGEGCEADHLGRREILDAWLGNKTPQNVAAWFSTPSNFPLLAEREDALVGISLLTQAGKLALCYVLPEAVRTGVGGTMLAAIEEQARTWCISKLHLHSPVSASAFFERHGYTNAGKEKACFGLECDLLWKVLNAEVSGQPRKRFCNCGGG